MEIKLINGILKKIYQFEKLNLLKQFLVCYFLGGIFMFIYTTFTIGFSFAILFDVLIGGLLPGIIVSGLAVQALKVVCEFIKKSNIFIIILGGILLFIWMMMWEKNVVN